MRIVSILIGLLFPLFIVAQVAFNDKVNPYLQEQVLAAPDVFHPIYILLEEKIDLEVWKEHLATKNTEKEEIYTQILLQLEQIANSSQAPLLARLEAMKEVQQESIVSLWITNAIQLNANANAINSISKWAEVERIEGVTQDIAFEATVSASSPPIPNGSEPGLTTINAHKLWELGYTGYGTKVLVVDSGTTDMHPALRPNYWGNNVPTSEAWTGDKRPEICSEHGTLVAGVAIGLDRTTNDTVGVAPNARWMSAPINFGDCSIGQNMLSTIQVLQWALNPDGDPNTMDDMPDVVNNSWGNINASCEQIYRDILTILEQFNVTLVWAAGNSGEDGAMSVYGTQNLSLTLVNTFTVGNLNGTTLVISDDSSRGPSYCPSTDNSLAIKPEVVAPGQGIRTTNGDGTYSSVNGTSFSSPHVAGALLLLKEAFPEVSSENAKLALYFSARDLGPEGEDNAYGMGLIDVFAAYNYLINTGNTPTPPSSHAHDMLMVDIDTERTVNCRGAIDVTIAFENAGTSAVQSLDIAYYLNGEESNSTFSKWTGNIGVDATKIHSLVSLEDLAPGEHELTVKISNPNGNADERDLNNVMKHYIQVLDLDYVDVALSAQYETPACQNSRVVLETNSNLAANQTVVWYDDPTDKLNRAKLGEGSPFVTDAITETTTFYADILTTSQVGKTEPGENQAASAAELGIVFDVLAPLTLVSVKVFAEGDGARRIIILDENDNQINSKITSLKDGENIIDFGINIEPGRAYSMMLSPIGNTKKLKIGNSADFPYEVSDIIRLTSSRSATTETSIRYFYFYDFNVRTLHPCGRTAISVDVNNATAPTAGFSVSAENIALDESGTINFTSTANSALTQHWDFGDGTQSENDNPSYTYTQAGEYIITQTVTNAAGCSDAVQKTITVVNSFETTSVSDIDEQRIVSVFPNPTSNYVVLQPYRARRMEVEVNDLYGRRIPVAISRPNSSGLVLNTTPLASGVYYLIIEIDGKKIVKKLVKTNE